uniref:Conotoxin superfamily M n=1 Tax=Conus magus TaxID=6492 RepID=A0A679PDD8_CONMA|nr:TPA_inf: conotoxin superfamily M [Conus magus]
MTKVEVVLLIFLVLLSLASLQNGDDPRRQRDEKQSPQRRIVQGTLRKYMYNIQRRCAYGTPCSDCTSAGKVCSVKSGGKGSCGTCVPGAK